MSNKYEKHDETPRTESEIAKAIRETVSELVPAVMALQNAALNPPISDAQKLANAEAAIRATNSKTTCGVCGQRLSGCSGRHRKVAVSPLNTNYTKWFQGVFINGVRYLSNNRNHLIDVPADCNIEYLVAQWEGNEQTQQQGRQGEHNSGNLGPGGGVAQPAVGWSR